MTDDYFKKPKAETVDLLKITQYLTNYSQNHKLDKAFINWLRRKDSTNPGKTKQQWDNYFSEFMAEV